MGNEEPLDPATPDPGEDDNALAHPVPPPSGVRRPERGERHLTRRVIAPAALLVVSVPVVALLFLNLRAVSDDDPTPAGASTSQSTTPTPTTSPSPTASATDEPSASATPTPTPTPTQTPSAPSGPRVSSVSSTAGPATGGQTITVTGTDLDPVTQVLFGQLNGANLSHVSSTEIRVTTPPGAGAVPVTFKAGADDVDTARTTYTYR